MALVVDISQANELQGQLRSWAYCALDATGTREIADNLLPRLSPAQKRIYNFAKAQQGPAVAMMLRGVLVDVHKRNILIGQLKREQVRDQRLLQKLPGIAGVWDMTEKNTGDCPAELGKKHLWHPRGADPHEQSCKRCSTPRLQLKEFNPGSSHQKKHLFYTLHKVQPMRNKTGEVSTDGDVLDRIGKKHKELAHITEAIIELQDKNKQLSTLAGKLTGGNRYPSSFNVGTAWTGRFSSSKNPFGLGGNLQNITERLRFVFTADPGYTIGYADLKQAESNAVAHFAGDEVYIEAHKSGDVHTFVTRLVWPKMGWTGDLKKDKAIAKQLPEWDNVEGHDFRFQCLTSNAEVLTKSGWHSVADMLDAEIAVWHENNTITWEKPSHWHSEPFKGNLVHMSSLRHNLTATPNHRVPVTAHGKPIVYEKTTGNLPEWGSIPISGYLDGQDGPQLHPQLWAATWADGHLDKKRGKTIFRFKKERKIERFKMIAEDAGLSMREYDYLAKGEAYVFVVDGLLPKSLSWGMVDWPTETKKLFLDELVHWDGTVGSKGNIVVNNKDVEGLQIIQTLQHLSGGSFNIIDYTKGVYGGSLSKTNKSWLRSSSKELVEFEGTVYCPTVSSGWFLVRENGKIQVTGNSKRIQHGSNFGLTPPGISMIAKIPISEARSAQENFFHEFPFIKGWQNKEAEAIRAHKPLVNAMGREILLFGRPNDPHTIKQGFAFKPQSTVADLLNLAMILVFLHLEPKGVQLLAQVHDALLFQFPRDKVELAKEVAHMMAIPIPIGERVMTIESELAIGDNWGHSSDANPHGLKEIDL